MNWQLRRQITTFLFATGIMLLLLLAAVSIIVGLQTLHHDTRLTALLNREGNNNALLLAVVEAETSVQGFLITGDPAYLQTYDHAIKRATELSEWANNVSRTRETPNGSNADLAHLIAEKEAVMSRQIETVRSRGIAAAQKLLRNDTGKVLMDEIRDALHSDAVRNQAEIGKAQAEIDANSKLFFALVRAAIVISLLLSVAQFYLFRKEIKQRGNIESELQRSNKEIATVARLSDMLHSANSREESYEIIEAFARDMLSGVSGCLYVYNHSRDQLDRAAKWGAMPSHEEDALYFHPDQCWGLRRGRFHFGNRIGSYINCQHVGVASSLSYICLPITARGQTAGLLHLKAGDFGDQAAFERMKTLAALFADQLSLALANIELREQLHNLAVRDPLTGLFNRRFLDETLGRELIRADRNKTTVAVMMIDVDHFKKFNDSFGHAAGDDVLKCVAGYLMTALRRSDVVCRYGGEELLIVLPDCGVEEAMAKAEKVRADIKALSVRSGGSVLPQITVSIGVACYPVTMSSKLNLIEGADQALYRAKRAGRDRVVLAGLANDGLAANQAKQPQPDLSIEKVA